MKVLQIISGMGVNSGGPTTCTYFLAKGLIKLNIKLEILTFKPQESDSLISDESFIRSLNRPYDIRFGYSKEFKEVINKEKVDIIHANGLWQYTTYSSAKKAFKDGTPFVISPHGMLYPEALNVSKYLKKIMLLLFQSSILKRASVIHATCEQESKFIKALGVNTPIAIIPNPIELPNIKQIENIQGDIKRIGFIGRFSPIKNLEILIDSWALSGKKHKDAELVLIGDGDDDYKRKIIDKIKFLGIKNVVFTGFLKGKEKENVLKSLNCLVLPSKSENFGMVVAEALSFKIPVIASKGAPWEDLVRYDCGWWVDVYKGDLAKVLGEVLTTEKEVLQIMGLNGRKLVEEKYSSEAVSKQMYHLYDWLLTKKNKPNFIK